MNVTSDGEECAGNKTRIVGVWYTDNKIGIPIEIQDIFVLIKDITETIKAMFYILVLERDLPDTNKKVSKIDKKIKKMLKKTTQEW